MLVGFAIAGASSCLTASDLKLALPGRGLARLGLGADGSRFPVSFPAPGGFSLRTRIESFLDDEPDARWFLLGAFSSSLPSRFAWD